MFEISAWAGQGHRWLAPGALTRREINCSRIVGREAVGGAAKDGQSAPEHAPRAFRVQKRDGRRLCSRLRAKSARIWARTQSAPVGIDAFFSKGHWCSVEDEIWSDLRPRASSEHLLSAGSQWERAACSARDECALWARLRGCLLLASLKVTEAPAGRRLRGFGAAWHTRSWRR